MADERHGDPHRIALIEALGISFSEQQLEAITAPLEPGVIIAGAGSGKTTVMAARVVWLVGTGAVRPEEVLGLTFTRKAAAELSQRVRTALLRDGVAYVQAGGGIVADSDPPTEDQESQNKAAAVVSAIAVAQSFRPVTA